MLKINAVIALKLSSIAFIMLINVNIYGLDKCWKIDTLLAFKLSDNVFLMLINFKMLTIVGILTFPSMTNSCSVELRMKKVL